MLNSYVAPYLLADSIRSYKLLLAHVSAIVYEFFKYRDVDMVSFKVSCFKFYVDL